MNSEIPETQSEIPKTQQASVDTPASVVVHDASAPARVDSETAHPGGAAAPASNPAEIERLRRWLRSAIVKTMRRRRRLTLRAAIASMLAEQRLIGARRHPSTRSHAETVISSLGKAAGDTVLDRAQAELGRLATAVDGLRAEQIGLIGRAERIPDELVPHPDGGVRTVAQTQADHDEHRAKVATDIRGGSLRYRRLPDALRHVPPVIFVCDALLLLYFFAGVTNVNWARPLAVALVIAIALAAIVTGLAFVYCRYVGDRLRHYKNDEGTLSLAGMDEWTKLSAGLAIVTAAVLAPFMFIRMRAEVLGDLGPHAQGTAVVVGAALAVVSILAVFVTIAVHALDGSPETDRLDAFANALAGPLSEQTALRQRADELSAEIATTIRKAERVAARARTRAGFQHAAADRAIDAARAIHQGVGPLSDVSVDPNTAEGIVGYRNAEAAPQVDERALGVTMHHVTTPLPHAQSHDERP